tara:strand:+ start:1362 stop:2333 length:972 start_codon:yes stop_codon:yes gene_type:complete
MLNPSAYEPSDSSSEGDSDEYYERDYTNNIGFHRKPKPNDGRFINNMKEMDYVNRRNKYFSPDIRCSRLLIDSSNHATTDKNNYIVRFDESENHSTEGYGVYKNVIGFRLISCGIPNRLKHVHSTNNTLSVTVGPKTQTIELDINTYTVATLITELKTKMDTAFSPNKFTITASAEGVLTIEETGTTNFSLNFLDSYNANSSIFSLLGFGKKNYSGENTYTADNQVKLRTPFIDVIIPEIPYMACKKNPHSKRIIERVSLASESNRYIFHSPEDYSETNYFTPINLDRITIQLFDEYNKIPYNAKDDNFFEFEIITMNNIDIL